MTDYAEEQSNELEALEAIYPDSFTGVDLGGSSFSRLPGCLVMCILFVGVCVITYFTSPKWHSSAFRPPNQLYHHCDFRRWRYWWQWVFQTLPGLFFGFQVGLLGRISLDQFGLREFHCHRSVQSLCACENTHSAGCSCSYILAVLVFLAYFCDCLSGWMPVNFDQVSVHS